MVSRASSVSQLFRDREFLALASTALALVTAGTFVVLVESGPIRDGVPAVTVGD